MRTLLIDNYDSFTYNLFQYLSEINGGNTSVIKNDELSFSEICELDFDNIVISPGPGTPENENDFGVCREVIEKIDVPILGICLGHQGIGSIFGSAVVNAYEVMHGRISKIYHNDNLLFEGIEQGFEAVRYHSLMIDHVGENVEKIAWCEDGTIMGIACRNRPVYGVQFHPESIKTQYGKKLLQNFMTIVDNYTSGKWYERKKCLCLRVRELEQDVSFENIFQLQYSDEKNVIWLDTSKVVEGFSRFSYLGCLGGAFSYAVYYNRNGKSLKVVKDDKEYHYNESIFDFLERQLANITLQKPEGAEYSFEFKGGFAGYFGYEMKEDCGYRTEFESKYPDSVMFFLDRFIVFDHLKGKQYLAALADEYTEAAVEEWFDNMETLLNGHCFKEERSYAIRQRSEETPSFSYYFDRSHEQYIEDIQTCFKKIYDGESYEICLTNNIYCDVDVDSVKYYMHLRKVNPAPYGCYMRFGDTSVVSTSIERFVKITEDGIAETRPMKGTCKRNPDPALDEQLRKRLENDEKNQSENLMICDLCRNDLGKVCKVGSVKVDKLMTVETYATVHQMTSTVSGILEDGVSIISCIKSLFPGGSMTGAPKKRTLEIIDMLEHKARGIYSGTIGYISIDGAVDLDIVIRTAVLTPGKVEIGIGGAITALSDAEEEYNEILLKGEALVKALNDVV